jgi:hypothetical protein
MKKRGPGRRVGCLDVCVCVLALSYQSDKCTGLEIHALGQVERGKVLRCSPPQRLACPLVQISRPHASGPQPQQVATSHPCRLHRRPTAALADARDCRRSAVGETKIKLMPWDRGPYGFRTGLGGAAGAGLLLMVRGGCPWTRKAGASCKL